MAGAGAEPSSPRKRHGEPTGALGLKCGGLLMGAAGITCCVFALPLSLLQVPCPGSFGALFGLAIRLISAPRARAGGAALVGLLGFTSTALYQPAWGRG